MIRVLTSSCARIILALAVFASHHLVAADAAAAINAQMNALRNANDNARLAAIKNLQQVAGGIKPMVQALTLALNDKNAEVRSGVARALADIGPSAREAVPALIPLLNDADETVRASAALALGEIGILPDRDGSLHYPAFCPLVFQLQDSSPSVRAHAAEALGKLGRAAASTAPFIRELLSDPDQETAIAAAIALAAMNEPEPSAARLYVLALRREGDAHMLADSALKRIGPPAVDALKSDLLDKAPDHRYIRRDAAATLERLGESARPAIPTLIEALADKDTEIQNGAALALLKLNAAPLEASSALLRLMRDSNEIRPRALAAFERMGERAADIPLAILKDEKDAPTRREAARVLARLAPRFAHTPEKLAAGLGDQDETVRTLLLEALSTCGAENKTLLPLFKSALHDKAYGVQLLAVKTLSEMRGELEAIVALADVRVHEPKSQVRNEVSRAVLAAGPDALAALPLLREALKSNDVSSRDWASQVIEKIGPPAADAIPELIEFLINSKDYRSETARVLGKMGAKAIDPLLAVLKSNDNNLRTYAGNALAYIGAPAVPKLTAALSDTNADFVEAAETALERMAPASAPAIPELIRNAYSKDGKIQSMAVQTLSKLGALAAPALINELRKDDEASRRVGAGTLGQCGPKAVPIICDVLRTEQEPAMVCALVESLGRIGVQAPDGVPSILDVAGRPYTGKDRVRVWSACANALGNIGASRETSVPLLFTILASDYKEAQGDAAQALRRLGADTLNVPPLADALRNSHPNYVGSALKTFGRAGMVQLVAEMSDESPQIRDAAAQAFNQLAPDCIPFLLSALDENPAASTGILLAIGEIRAMEIERRSPKANKQLEELQKALDTCTPALTKKIQSSAPDEVIAALWAYGKPVGAESLPLVVKNLAACSASLQPRGVLALNYYDVRNQSRALAPVLPILLKATSSNLHRQTNNILKSAGYSAESIPALSAAVEDPDGNVRNVAVTAIKGLGAEARSGVSLLVQILDRGTPQIANGAMTALVGIGTDAVPALIKALGAENPKLRANAQNGLNSMKLAQLAPHIKLLAATAKDEREEVCISALRLISNLQQDGRAAEADVRALLSRDNETTFHEAVRTLKKIGADVFGALAPQAENPNEDLALRAINEMHGAAGDPGATIAFVRKILKNENPKIRAAAVLVLPLKDNGVAESIPVAAAALKDANYLVRVSAARWLYDVAPQKPDATLPLLVAGLADDYETVGAVSRRALIALAEKAKPALPDIQKLINDPRKETQANAARVLIKLGVQDPLTQMIYNEATVLSKVEEYHQSQEFFFEEHWTGENTHFYAPNFLETWGNAKKDYLELLDKTTGIFNLAGYKLKVLTGQSARADGGKKDWLVNGALVGGHAVIAWPAQPGVTGRAVYMCGPDGSIYERPIVAADAPLIDAMAAAFDPGPEWKKIFTPEKPEQRPIPHDYFKPKAQPNEQMEF
ncbi:MAG TPA: DUF2950 family protein [Planctomycetota bacterium]|nr:DUF2950 family protein [Planctomycetota bacterium]